MKTLMESWRGFLNEGDLPDKVHAKATKLQDEGYPRDQAYAIAADMNRDGKLKEADEDLPAAIRKALRDEGGAAGMKALKDLTGASEAEIKQAMEDMEDVGQHEDGDYILEDDEEIDVIDEKKKKKKKKKKKAKKKDACYHKVKRRYKVWPSAYASGALVKCRKVGAKNWGNKTKEDVEEDGEVLEEEGLKAWFDDADGDGQKGWVQVGGKYDGKPCAKQPGQKTKPKCVSPEKRKTMSKKERESAARRKRKKDPNPDRRGKAKNVATDPKKKKSKKESLNINEFIENYIAENLLGSGLQEHIAKGIPVHQNLYRIGSTCYFNMFRQARNLDKLGLYESSNEEELYYLRETNLGEWAMFEGEEVPLDFPMYEETLEEKKDPPIGKPTKNTGGGKKYKVYVRNPKTGNVKKITYGDSKGGLKGNWNNAEARKSFAARHNCADKKDRTKAGYWACRAHKDFGKNVPGRFW